MTDTGGSGHPYRAGDGPLTLDPEIERCLVWRRRRQRRLKATNVPIALAALAACIALTRVHWAGWILFGIVALWLVPVTVVLLIVARRDSRFDERLRRDPGQLAYLHLEFEPPRGALCACDLKLRDGTSSTLYLPPDLVHRLAVQASQLPFVVTRTKHAHTAYQTDARLRRLEDQLRRQESSLASSLAPFLLPIIEDRSCAALPADKLASLKAALDELEVLFVAAASVDANRQRSRLGVRPEIADLLDSDPPYAEKATRLVDVIREAFVGHRPG